MAVINGQHRYLHLVIDGGVVCDSDGGCDVLDYTDEEAVILFREWLLTERKRRAHPSLVKKNRDSIRLVNRNP